MKAPKAFDRNDIKTYDDYDGDFKEIKSMIRMYGIDGVLQMTSDGCKEIIAKGPHAQNEKSKTMLQHLDTLIVDIKNLIGNRQED